MYDFKAPETKYKGGWLRAILNTAAFLGTAVANALNSLADKGIEMDDAKKSEDGGLIFKGKTGGGKQFKVKCVPTSGRSGLMDLYIKTEDGKKADYPHIREDQIDDKITDFIDKIWGEALEEGYKEAKDSDRTQDEEADFDIDSNRHIRVTLQRITSGSESTINTLALETNYAPYDAYEDLLEVCNDDEFCNQLTDQPTSFDIVSDDSEYSINKCNCDPNTDNTYNDLLVCMYSVVLHFQDLHWNSFGQRFMRIHTMLDDYIEKSFSDIDVIAEIALRTHQYVENPVNLVKLIEPMISETTNIDSRDAIQYTKNIIDKLLATLEFYYPNVPHEVQSILDEWINYWKTEADYKLTRMLK